MLRATSLRTVSVQRPQLSRTPCVRAPAPRSALMLHQLSEAAAAVADAAAPGSVNAPIGVVIAAAVFITVAATALVPLALKPGDEAANKIFSGANLRKTTTVKKPAAGSKAAKK